MPRLNIAKTCLLCGDAIPCICCDHQRQEDKELAEYYRIMDALDEKLFASINKGDNDGHGDSICLVCDNYIESCKCGDSSHDDHVCSDCYDNPCHCNLDDSDLMHDLTLWHYLHNI